MAEIKARRDIEGRALTRGDLYDAIMEGAVERVRPKMMTVVAIMAGLLPIMWSTGTGSEIMQRIAVPMIGGMISSTLLTLIVIPAIFGLVKGLSVAERTKCRAKPSSRRLRRCSLSRSAHKRMPQQCVHHDRQPNSGWYQPIRYRRQILPKG